MSSIRMNTAHAVTALCVLASLTVVGVTPAFAGTDSAAGQATAAHSRRIPADELRAAAKHAVDYWTPQRMLSATAVDTPAASAAVPSRAEQAAQARGTPGRANPVQPNPVAQLASGVPTAPVGVDAPTISAVSNGQTWTSGGLPSTAIGVAFFTNDAGEPKYCTASALASDAGNAVLTAGHCVINASNGRWYNWNYQTNTWGDWIFVPGYNYGSAPFGLWYANQLWTVPQYISSGGDSRYDIGAAVMNVNYYGYHLQDVVGSEGIEWNWPLSQYNWVFGYPQDGAPSFDGQRLIFCHGQTYSYPFLPFWEVINCNQGHGSSGGPWLDDFDGSWGWADSVISTGTSSTDIGPYFGNHAFNLWSNVRYL